MQFFAALFRLAAFFALAERSTPHQPGGFDFLAEPEDCAKGGIMPC
jgi:hypothetical protein